MNKVVTSSAGFVLDFGCGEGTWLRDNGGENVVGMDAERATLEKARRTAVEGTNFVLADGSRLPFRGQTFSKIRVYWVLHHVGDFRLAVAELARCLDGQMDIMESVDNYLLFSIARRVRSDWQKVPVRSFFRSWPLEAEIKKYFVIDAVEYTWMPVSLIVLAYLKGGTFTFVNGKVARIVALINTLLGKMKLLKFFATQVRIQAHNNVRGMCEIKQDNGSR